MGWAIAVVADADRGGVAAVILEELGDDETRAMSIFVLAELGAGPAGAANSGIVGCCGGGIVSVGFCGATSDGIAIVDAGRFVAAFAGMSGCVNDVGTSAEGNGTGGI